MRKNHSKIVCIKLVYPLTSDFYTVKCISPQIKVIYLKMHSENMKLIHIKIIVVSKVT